MEKSKDKEISDEILERVAGGSGRYSSKIFGYCLSCGGAVKYNMSDGEDINCWLECTKCHKINPEFKILCDII